MSDDAWAYALTSPYEAGNETAFQGASEQLRIMVLSGPYGSKAICNRVAQTVEIGAPEGDEDGGEGQQGGGSDEDDEGDESGAMMYSPYSDRLAVGAVACALVAHWL